MSLEEQRPSSGPVARYLRRASEAFGNANQTGLEIIASSPEATSAPPFETGVQPVLNDIDQRALSIRQEARIGEALRSTIQTIQELLDNGEVPRDDGFFQNSEATGRRAEAQEIAEGVLLAASNQHEERKIPFIGSLMGTVGFDSTIDANTANWAINLANELTWGEYLVLSLVAQPETYDIPQEYESGGSVRSWRASTILEQFHKLHWTLELLGTVSDDGEISLRLCDQRLRRQGHLLVELLNLKSIPRDDVARVLQDLAHVDPD